ncbi:MAG: hypothetical protein PHU24_09715 [Sphaerochaetaceae bacterium]|jgi:tetratricopeptide (TPR) repeat protein|nr:hypothetical protein [Sphaerochaetaceae bacterium]NLO61323.1 hypothetical protein [Spirochaetales bacterium]MDD2406720.1 hypothetical protein [Sphaerochaetaceae bacterium]MDD3671547.1 hypothetical protein [Sphaerochaetaceae bacterium]MDD4259670.1 hypothetical protein [Sphaerochaetaceae bacterium]
MQRKAILLFALMFVLSISFVFASAAELDQADVLYKQDKLEEAKIVLDKLLVNATDPVSKAEILWRLSRVTLNIGDELDAEGATDDVLFAKYEEAQAYAEESIALHPMSKGYQWRSASVGRWGETKGPLNALSKAPLLRDDLTVVVNDYNDVDNSDAWYVLGQLYFQLPGWPISFGDLDVAISYTRKALDTIPSDELYPNHYLALSKMLWKRNWNVSKRSSKINDFQKSWNKANQTNIERHKYYEGAEGTSKVPFYSTVALNKMSDKQEAVLLLNYAIAAFKVWKNPSRGDLRSYNDIQAMLKEYGY